MTHPLKLNVVATMLGVLLTALQLGGCGGTATAGGPSTEIVPGGVAGAGSAVDTGRGSLVFHVAWPVREAPAGGTRLIPLASESILIQLLDGRQNVAREITLRYGVAEAVIDDVPVGSYIVFAQAKPALDGTGVTQAQGTEHVIIAANGTADVQLTMDSRVASFVIDGPPLTVGGLTTLTATAYNAKGQVVLLPTPNNANWALSPTSGQGFANATELVYTARLGGDQTKYSIALLGRQPGSLHVEATVDEDGVGPTPPRTAVRDLEIVAIRESPDGSDVGYRQELGLHDELLLNQGFDGSTGRQKPSPFEDIDPVLDVYNRKAGSETTFKLAWSTDERSHASGAALDASVEASYQFGVGSVGGGASTSYSTAQREDSYRCSLHQTTYKDYGEFWISTNKLRLKPEALKTLAEDPDDFIRIYGDRFVVGEKRWAYLTAQYSCSSVSKTFEEQLGIKVQVDGSYGPYSGSASVSSTSWLNDAVSKTSVDVVVSTNARASDKLGEIIRETVSKNNGSRSQQIVTKISEIAERIDATTPTAYRMIVVPMSWVIPALNRSYQLFPGSVSQHMTRLQRLLRQKKQLDPIVAGLGHGKAYAFLPASRKQDLESVLPEVTQAISDEEDILRRFFHNQEVPQELSELEQAGFPVAWPDPYIIVDQFDVVAFIRRNPANSYAWGYRYVVDLSFHALDMAGPIKALLIGPNNYEVPFTGDANAARWSAHLDQYWEGDPAYVGGSGRKDAYYWVGEQALSVPIRLQDPNDNRVVYLEQRVARQRETVY
ncbi:MAG: hypothetical protein IT204_16410 [Fimbriimonadaceae bacterium]|nr:hypothetical protein [Fimbriimonadaceae bacterium]